MITIDERPKAVSIYGYHGKRDSFMKNEKLSAALFYQSRGLSIIPVGANKKALIDWKEYQSRIATIEEINQWWTKFPNANIALVTGKISGVVVLDLDKKYGRTSKEFQIPPTVSARSGNGGEHFLFKYPGIFVKSGSAISGQGVDIRGDGGYVLLDPSVNETGGKYVWIIPFESKEDLAEMPEWLKKLTTDDATKKKWLTGQDGVPNGFRNDTAVSMAGKILSNTTPELWESMGWEQLKIWNNKNTPPIPEKELRIKWEGIKKLHVSKNKPQKQIAKRQLIAKCFAEIQSVPISWLWEGRIPLGKLFMLVGDPGLGKSLVTDTLAAHVTRGFPFPVDNCTPPVGDVVILSAEDDPADTIKPRLEAVEADCTRIHFIEAVRVESIEGESTQHSFSLKNDIETLGELLSRLPNCRLVIIDPISAYLDSTDSNNNSDIRGLLAPLTELASKHKVAIVLVSHLNKNSGESALYRTTGSLAFIAAVRAAYIVIKDKDNPNRRLLLPLKSNISKDNAGLAYSIVEAENGQPVIAWEPNAVETTAEEALARPESKKELTATHEAELFLLDLLLKGEMKVSDILKEAKEAGIKDKPLRTARENLGIKTEKVGFNPSYRVWKLPEDAQSNENAIPTGEGKLDNAGHVGGMVDLFNGNNKEVIS